MSGIPGSGKDTWIQENLADWKVISLDEIRKQINVDPEDDQSIVINQAKSAAKEYMRKEVSFVWNATNLTRQLRSSLVSLFTGYGASVRIVYREADWEELLKRNQIRIAKVPENVLYRMRNRLEVPNITEAHQVDWFD
jgi:predicted kinase